MGVSVAVSAGAAGATVFYVSDGARFDARLGDDRLGIMSCNCCNLFYGVNFESYELGD